MSIKATEEQLNKIFNLINYQFEIPSYQRPYAWTKDQVLELIDDLIDAFPYPLEQDNPDYFFGSIILIKEDGKPNAEVIDGQQRLTTLTLLLSVFRHLLPEGHPTINKIGKLLEDEDITGTNTLSGLQLRSQDNEFFGELIRTAGGLKKLLEKDAGLETDSQTLLRDNATVLVKELTERCPDPDHLSLESWILHLYTNLLTKCYLVVVSTSDFDTAYRIFSTINSRGLDLELNDILKSEIIGKIEKEEDKQKYTEIWDNEEKDLGREDFKDLFSHIHRIKLREKPKGNLLAEYRQKIKPQDNPTQFIDQVLKPCSDKFEVIRDQKFSCDSKEEKTQINRLFGWLNLIDNSDWLPPAIYFLVKHPDKTSNIKNFFTNFERLAAGLMIIRADINDRGRRYARVLDAIDEGAEKAIALTKELLSPQEQNQIIEILDGDLYQQTRSRLYVLKRLDSELAEGGLSPSFDAKLVTIEHVLPQNPKSDSEWCKIWQDEAREKWVHRLGNLVLLSRRKNAQAQNYDFEKKKTKYFGLKEGERNLGWDFWFSIIKTTLNKEFEVLKLLLTTLFFAHPKKNADLSKKKVTTFPLTTLVGHQNEWNEQIVNDNHQEYLCILLNLWNFQQSTIPTPPKKSKPIWKPPIKPKNGDHSNIYWHNIGGNNDKWWSYLKANNVITCGFEDKAGDEGEKILTSYRKGDTIIAYASGFGVIGWGVIKEYPTYRLIEAGSPEDVGNGNHMHRLNIEWQCVADKIEDAISAGDVLSKFDIHHPVKTSVHISDKEMAKLLIQEIENKFNRF